MLKLSDPQNCKDKVCINVPIVRSAGRLSVMHSELLIYCTQSSLEEMVVGLLASVYIQYSRKLQKVVSFSASAVELHPVFGQRSHHLPPTRVLSGFSFEVKFL